MSGIHLLPIGPVDEDPLIAIGSGIRCTFGVAVHRLQHIEVPDYAFDSVRNQYSSELILRRIAQRSSDGAVRILAVTDVDLFIPMLTFVYGQAQLNGKTSLISTARMRQEFYGLPPSRALMLRRVVKESLHELGHTFGLTHCLVPSCPMVVATVISQLDAKGETLCSDCSFLLKRALSRLSQT